MATNAKYKIYDASANSGAGAWVEYHFTTNAGQVSTTSARKFLTSSVTVNNIAFQIGSGDAASVSIDGSDIQGCATAPTGKSLTYLSNSDTIASALGKLDVAAKAAYDAVPDLSGYIPTSGTNALSGDIVPTTANQTKLGSASKYFNYVYTYNVKSGTHLYLESGSSDTSVFLKGSRIYLRGKSSGSIFAVLSTDALTENRDYAFPDKSGTFALTNDLGNAASKGVATSISSSSTNNDLATALAVYNAISNLPTPMQFKGTLGTGGTITTLPAAATANNGFMYKVITAGTYQSVAAKVGDALISNGSAWVLIPSGDESFTDTWRAIKVGGSDFMTNAITSGSINFTSANNISVTGSNGNTITVGVASGYSIPSTDAQAAWSAKYDKPSGGIPGSDLATSYIPLAGTSSLGGDITPDTAGSRSLGSTSKYLSKVVSSTFTAVGDAIGYRVLGSTTDTCFAGNAIKFVTTGTNTVSNTLTLPKTTGTVAVVSAGTTAPTAATGVIWIDTN